MGLVLDNIILRFFPDSQRAGRAKTRNLKREASGLIKAASRQWDDGSAWAASDCSFLARVVARKTKDPMFIAEVEEASREFTFGGYSPLSSRDHGIRLVAYVEAQEVNNTGP